MEKKKYIKWYLELANQECQGRIRELRANITHQKCGRM